MSLCLAILRAPTGDAWPLDGWGGPALIIVSLAIGFTIGRRRRGSATSKPSPPSNIFASAEATDLGLLSIDANGNLTKWSPGIGPRLGLSSMETTTLIHARRWRQNIHESDQPALSSIIDDASPTHTGQGQFRVKDESQGWRWMYAQCLADEFGSMQMLLVDLTDRVETERQQQEAAHVHRVVATVIETR